MRAERPAALRRNKPLPSSHGDAAAPMRRHFDDDAVKPRGRVASLAIQPRIVRLASNPPKRVGHRDARRSRAATSPVPTAPHAPWISRRGATGRRNHRRQIMKVGVVSAGSAFSASAMLYFAAAADSDGRCRIRIEALLDAPGGRGACPLAPTWVNAGGRLSLARATANSLGGGRRRLKAIAAMP